MLVDIIVGQLVVPVSWQLRFRKLSTVYSTRGILVLSVYVFSCVAWHTHTRLFYFLIIRVGWWTCLLVIFVIAVLIILFESCGCFCYTLILFRIVDVVIRRIVLIGFRVNDGVNVAINAFDMLLTLPCIFTFYGFNVVFASTDGSLSILTCQSV